ncbi:MAG: hypothetical protein LBD15_03340 [Holosporales bacterium]|nr:hypothetical protein [Holosporales bacterium]
MQKDEESESLFAAKKVAVFIYKILLNSYGEIRGQKKGGEEEEKNEGEIRLSSIH